MRISVRDSICAILDGTPDKKYRMRKAAFLDRDGVINEKPSAGQYITRWEDLRILPGVAEGIALLNQTGFLVIVASNQRCVAKGLITTQSLESMHRRMCDLLAKAGATIDGLYYCPHEKEINCSCRKPRPGMLLSAASAHGIDLKASWMIGDSGTDVETGKNAGCKTAHLIDAKGKVAGIDVVASSLLDATQQILQREGFIQQRQRSFLK